jgi:CRP-like cAMP-binding protein
MKIKEFERGQIIFKQGDLDSCMYDIQRGRIGVYSAYGTPEEKLIAELVEGQTVGEMGMIERVPRSATAVVLDDGTILGEIHEEDLKDYFLKQPEKLLLIMRDLSSHLRETTAKLAGVCSRICEIENR